MGLGSTRDSTPDRRDRLWSINAFAVVLLTLLGAAGEQLGYDRHLKTNTTKRRTQDRIKNHLQQAQQIGSHGASLA
jgi:hypothetical protein